jgi:hypothetical protein
MEDLLLAHSQGEDVGKDVLGLLEEGFILDEGCGVFLETLRNKILQ